MVNSKIAAFGSTRRANIKCDDDSNIQSLLKFETKSNNFSWKDLGLSCC